MLAKRACLIGRRETYQKDNSLSLVRVSNSFGSSRKGGVGGGGGGGGDTLGKLGSGERITLSQPFW